MTYELNGFDMDKKDNWEQYLTAFRNARRDATLKFDEPGTYTPWAEANPDGSRNFLLHCIGHHRPLIRLLAGTVADDWVGTQPTLTVDVMKRALDDRAEMVREGVGSYVHDLLTLDKKHERFFRRQIGSVAVSELNDLMARQQRHSNP